MVNSSHSLIAPESDATLSSHSLSHQSSPVPELVPVQQGFISGPSSHFISRKEHQYRRRSHPLTFGLSVRNEDDEFSMSEGHDCRNLKRSILQQKVDFAATNRPEFNGASSSLLLRLPTEVFMQIINYLDRKDLFLLLTVCREFSNLIVEILWFRPNMQTDSSFKIIRNIMKLPAQETHWDYKRYIKRLNLSFMTKLVDDELLSLFYDCPRLERLTLVNCTRVTHAPITRMLQKCDRLQSIDLLGVPIIHDDIIYALARNCTRLQGLYAPGCGQVSEEAILILLQSCPLLKRIKFNNSDALTDETTRVMYQNCKSLVEIDLHNCPQITDKYLRVIFLELIQLREFRISNALGVTDNLFELIPNEAYLEKLRIMDITGCNAITDKFVEKLVVRAPRLRNVVVSKCFQITDASLRALSHLGRSLHYVHLGHCSHITDFGVASLVRACHRIQYIDLACCTQLTDWTLVELTNLPKLRRIGLVKCNLITDHGITELVRRRGEHDCLERVHLSYCTNLTISPIYYLLRSCPKLTHLSLTGIASFLRRDITQFCREPPPDFNQLQRDSFCVFLGYGVNQLRDHLGHKLGAPQFYLESDIGAGIDVRRRDDVGRRNGLGYIHPLTTQHNLSTEGGLSHPPLMGPNLWEERVGMNREIFRELHEGNMNAEEIRLHYQMIMARQDLQRQQQQLRELIRRRQEAGPGAATVGGMTNIGNIGDEGTFTLHEPMLLQMRLEDRMNLARFQTVNNTEESVATPNPLFAPQIMHQPTFVNFPDDGNDVEMADSSI